MSAALENFHTKDYLTDNIIIVTPESSVVDVYQKMQRSQVRHVPVVENGEPVGMISDRDVKFVSYANEVTQLQAKDIMTNNPYTVTVDVPLRDIVTTMSRKKIGSCIIAGESGKIAGIFTSTDALNILAESFPREEEE